MVAPSDRHIFVAYPWALYDRVRYKRAFTTVQKALNVQFIFAEERVSTGHVLDKISGMIESCAFGIYDVSGWNANVTLEYGIARGLNADAYIAFNPSKTDLSDVPSDVRGYDRLQYDDLDDLKSAVEGLVVQVLGTGTDSTIDPLERDRQRLMDIIGSNPSETTQVLAKLMDERIDYVQLLLRRSKPQLDADGATRGTRYTLKASSLSVKKKTSARKGGKALVSKKATPRKRTVAKKS